MRYLADYLIRESFLRLRQNETGGKTGLERTSVLVCFLAFDALVKRTGVKPPLDLNPEVSIGNNNRSGLTREFSRLVQLKTGSEPYYVVNLGEVAVGGNPPEKRFSSNFLTTAMKKATTSVTPYEYPARPANPLLLLGPSATGLMWGMDRHSDWKINLPVFLEGRKTKTPFTDLAIFVLRQRGIDSEAENLQEGLFDGLCEIFTVELCEFWKKQISLEKVYFGSADTPFNGTASSPFSDCSWMGNFQSTDKASVLTSRVSYLEGLLKVHNIPFEQ